MTFTVVEVWAEGFSSGYFLAKEQPTFRMIKISRLISLIRPLSLSYRASSNLVGRDFLTLKDFKVDEIHRLLARSAAFKQSKNVEPVLRGKNIALIFEKRSTRTRLSMETGINALGGNAIFLGPSDSHLGEGESVRDTARVMSGFVDAIFGRVYRHEMLEELAKHATVPVINGLSDVYHPLQGVADVFTLQEHFKTTVGLTLAWVGDGNNIVHSLMMLAPKLGIHINIATPKGYEVLPHVLHDANAMACQYGTRLNVTNDPVVACTGANVIVTDTWVSMGEEDMAEKKISDFAGYQVTEKLGEVAADDWRFMHCLPRKKYEVDDTVFYSDRSLVWREAENRKWTAMAVLAEMLSG